MVVDDLGEEHVDRGGHVDAHSVEGFCGAFFEVVVGAYLDSCIQLHHFSVCELFVLLLYLFFAVLVAVGIAAGRVGTMYCMGLRLSVNCSCMRYWAGGMCCCIYKHIARCTVCQVC